MYGNKSMSNTGVITPKGSIQPLKSEKRPYSPK